MSRPVSARPWPLQPLLAAAGAAHLTELAERCHISHSTLTAAAADGLTDRQADTWATRCGLHPAHVWGWEWHQWALDNLPDDEEVTAA